MRRVPGHEFTGVVHTLGKGVTTDSLRRPLKEGDRVAFPFFNPCNRCYWCMRGEHHACPHRHRKSQQFTLNEYPYCDGGYAEYYYLPPGHYVFKVPDVLPDEAIPPVNCALCQVLHGIEYSRHEVRRHRRHPGRRRPRHLRRGRRRREGRLEGHLDRQAAAAPGPWRKNCGATDVIDINEFPTPEARVQR